MVRFLHLPAIARLRGAELTVLADPAAAARAEALARFPGATAVSDWREAIEREDVDAVIVCLPTHLHAEAAETAFRLGRHVYVEKPLASEAHDARRVIAAAAASDRVGMSGFNLRFHPVYRRLKERIDNDDAGEIVQVATAFTVPPRALPAWKSDRRTGGGAMLDQLSHHGDLLRHLIQARPQRVQAALRSVRHDDDTAAVITELDSGVLVNSTLSLCTAEQDRVEILGTRGKLVADRIAAQVWFEPAGGGYTRVDRIDRLAGTTLRALTLGKHIARPGGETGHAASLQAFVDGCRAGVSPVPLEEGARSLAWVLAAERAARSGESAGPDFEAVGLAAEPAKKTDAESFPKAADLPAIPRADDTEPLATVVLAVSGVDESVRNVVRHVRAQTLAARLEFIVVAETQRQADDLLSLAPGQAETLGSTSAVATGQPVTNVDAEAARGVLLARGPVACVIEDHAYPAADWVERLLEAYDTPEQVGAAGACVLNANPRSSLSRANLLVAYGAWLPPLAGGLEPSGHNVSYRTDAVAVYADSLARRISRGGSIMADLQARGFGVKVVAEARVHHANPSRFRNTAALRFDGGRLFGAGKAEEGRWSGPKRAAYAVLSPAIAGLRLADARPKLAEVGARGLPALAFALAMDALGQGMGFAFGVGGARSRLEAFELGRLRHLREHDRRLLTSPGLRFQATGAEP